MRESGKVKAAYGRQPGEGVPELLNVVRLRHPLSDEPLQPLGAAQAASVITT
jgi:hypothetical protein